MRLLSFPPIKLLSLLVVFWFTPLLASEYVVQPGDTLNGIARQHLPAAMQNDSQAIKAFVNQVVTNNPARFPERNPNLLSIGMKLNLPDPTPSVEPSPTPLITPQANNTDTADRNIAQITALEGRGLLLHSDESSENLFVGQSLQQGDSIQTANQSTASIKFTDQSSIIVKPSSEINIEQFSWNEQEKSGISVVGFLKGAFRAVSGQIAEEEPENYSVTTPVATIGVRGTNFGARYCEQATCEVQTGDNSITLSQGIYIGVLEGQIIAKSGDTETAVNSGEAIYQKDAASPVKRVQNLPGLIFSADELNTYSSKTKTLVTQAKPANKPKPQKKPKSTLKPKPKPKVPFYRAFWRDSEGKVARDSQGKCIRSSEYRSDHHVAECN